jgi:hypothetical protein
MTQKNRKKTAKKPASGFNLTEALGGFLRKDREEIESILEDPLKLFPEHNEDHNNQAAVSRPGRRQVKKTQPKKQTSSKNATQAEIQRKLVLALADNSHFSLDDIHKCWLQFDPLVEWHYEIQKKNQPELAAELVRKATRQNKLSELEKTMNSIT